jgi:hypothetical protein
MSKGSRPRPLAVDHKIYGMRWEAVFRPRMQEEEDAAPAAPETATPEAPTDE